MLGFENKGLDIPPPTKCEVMYLVSILVSMHNQLQNLWAPLHQNVKNVIIGKAWCEIPKVAPWVNTET